MPLIISNKYKYIFFHIPKNAGSSVGDILLRNEDNYIIRKTITKIFNFSKITKKDNLHYDVFNKKFFLTRSHETPIFIKNKIKNKIFNSYFKFAIVRNPFSRFVSRYNYYKKLNTVKNDITFKEFLINHIKLNFISDRQYDFLSDEFGNICMDKIIKFEHLKEGLFSISEKININLDNLKKINQATFENYKNYYDNDTIKIVEQFCKKDLTFFNYRF